MFLPEDCWIHIHTYLKIQDYCWPCYVAPKLRKYTTFCARLTRAKPLHGLFTNIYQSCVINGCNASREASRQFIVSPYNIVYLYDIYV